MAFLPVLELWPHLFQGLKTAKFLRREDVSPTSDLQHAGNVRHFAQNTSVVDGIRRCHFPQLNSDFVFVTEPRQFFLISYI